MVVVRDCVGQLAVVAEKLLWFGVKESILEHSEVGVVVEISGVELNEIDLRAVEGGVLEFEFSWELRREVDVPVGFHVVRVDQEVLVWLAVAFNVEADFAVHRSVRSFLIGEADVDVLGRELEAAEMEHDGNVEFPRE